MGYTPTETDIQRAVLDQLRVCHIPAWRNNSGVFSTTTGRPIRAGVKGAPDILGVLPPDGRFLGIEIKRPGKELTLPQRVFHDAIGRAGGLVLVVHSARELMDTLERLGWKTP